MGAQVWAAYVTGLLSGLFALVAFWLNSRNEQARRTSLERREDLIWFRNAIAEAYSQAIYYLFKLSVSAASAGLDDKDVRQHLSESQRHLLLLHAYHARPEIKVHLLEAVRELDTNGNLSDAATSGLKLVRDLFIADPRINVRE
jgi:hypothetical protein